MPRTCDTATAPLWTHHQVLELAAPFAQQGLRLDMAASDRMRRSLVFRQAEAFPGAASSTVEELEACGAPTLTLTLDSPRPGHFRLVRSVGSRDGDPRARLEAVGALPVRLLQQLQAMPPEQQFHAGPGYRMVVSGCVTETDTRDVAFHLTHALLLTDALTMSLTVGLTAPASGPAALRSGIVAIRAHRADSALPADLLAVLGWDWSLLQANAEGWHGSMRLRGVGRGQKPMADNLQKAALHMARTLAEPPQRYHLRLRRARWAVMVRHGIPVFVLALLATGTLFADALHQARASPLTLVLMGLPPGLLMLYLLRSERPRLALPSWPRALAHQAWSVVR